MRRHPQNGKEGRVDLHGVPCRATRRAASDDTTCRIGRYGVPRKTPPRQVFVPSLFFIDIPEI